MDAEMTETQAKAQWEDLAPEPGSIMAYHMAAAVESLEARHDNPTTEPSYHLELMEELDEYEHERRNSCCDTKYLNRCLSLYGESPELLAAIAKLQV